MPTPKSGGGAGTSSSRPAATGPSSVSGPSSGAGVDTSKVLSRPFQVRQYTVKTTGAIEQAFGGDPRDYQSALIYAAQGIANGILQANGNDIYIGRYPTLLPELRTSTDTNYPVLFEDTQGSKFKLADLYVSGTAGDGIVILFY